MPVSIRDKLRGTVMKSRKGESKLIPFREAEVEVRCPPLEDVLKAREDAKEDAVGAAVKMIINYVCVPGTDERLFEVGDADSIRKFAFDKDMVLLQKTITELTGIDIEAEIKNSETAPSDESSSS